MTQQRVSSSEAIMTGFNIPSDSDACELQVAELEGQKGVLAKKQD